jgi:hypothetical protein
MDFVAKTNKHGQTVILSTADAEGPHLSVSWYLAGMGEGGYTSVRAGETDEQAAHRAFGKHSYKPGTFRFQRVELT